MKMPGAAAAPAVAATPAELKKKAAGHHRAASKAAAADSSGKVKPASQIKVDAKSLAAYAWIYPKPDSA